MFAYFDCFSGISGDMTLAAFVDLGVPLEWLQEKISALPLSGFDITSVSIERSGITAQQIHVRTRAGASRDYRQIKSLISGSGLSCRVKQTSLEIFRRIAAAEAGIHGCELDHVHFHEVGGVDAIVDIVGAALCIEYLGIERVAASPLPLGSGFVETRHGTLPLPAPATLSILKNIPVYGTSIPCELVTPTGAAVIAALAERFGPMPAIMPAGIGYGAGLRDIQGRPNLLRIVLGAEKDGRLESDRVDVLETCIDDMNPEMYGFLMERLFEDGALDVYWMPIYMKKNRPGILVQALASPECREAITRRLLSETTSLGVRCRSVERRTLPRDSIDIETGFGRVGAKRIYELNGGIRIVPEYEACRRIALEHKVPLRHVYDAVVRAAAEPSDGIEGQAFRG